VINKQIKIFDSTTIILFQDILKCAGRKHASGKRKGGIKMHTIKFKFFLANSIVGAGLKSALTLPSTRYKVFIALFSPA
jgi:hypothetical protein